MDGYPSSGDATLAEDFMGRGAAAARPRALCLIGSPLGRSTPAAQAREYRGQT
jgi:hypothetical protein